jgi:hypothetical protein
LLYNILKNTFFYLKCFLKYTSSDFFWQCSMLPQRVLWGDTKCHPGQPKLPQGNKPQLVSKQARGCPKSPS